MISLKRDIISKDYFDYDPAEDCSGGDPRKVRLYGFLSLIRKIGVIPFILIIKTAKTLLCLIGLFRTFVFLVVTLGVVENTRRRFLQNVHIFSDVMADWILLPFAFMACLIRLGMVIMRGVDF